MTKKITIFDLRPGEEYGVKEPFEDADGLFHPTGESWTYKELKYDEESELHTLIVDIDGDEYSFRLRLNSEGNMVHHCMKIVCLRQPFRDDEEGEEEGDEGEEEEDKEDKEDVSEHNAVLHAAVLNRDAAMAAAMLEAGADPNGLLPGGDRTPLMTAFEQGYSNAEPGNQEKEFFATVKTLIDHGADMNLRVKEAYHRSAAFYLFLGDMTKERMKMVDFALANGLEPNAVTDEMADTCMHFACGRKYRGKWNYNTVEKLIGAGWDVNQSNNFGRTPLMYFAESGNEVTQGVAALLIKNGAAVNEVDQLEYSALMLACFNPTEASGRLIAELVLNEGADTGKVTFRNESALDFAVQNKRKTIEELLKERGA
jgi:ankyrin repeat protein